jgi:SAM-dependent methyltransferase
MIDRASTGRRRFWFLSRLGIRPSLTEVVHQTLDATVAHAEARHPRALGRSVTLDVLDAGCGGSAFLQHYRARINHLVGLDIHAPGAPSPNFDAIVEADMCREPDAFPPASFHIIMSKFTIEHLADPAAAFAAFRSWLRPGGSVVLVTVNRRHPFVAAYLDLPPGPRSRLQPLVKGSHADAHPLVGACNDPRALRASLEAAGFERVEIQSVGNLARAWGRWGPGYLLGLAGDIVAQPFPPRRSTLVVSAHAPEA